MNSEICEGKFNLKRNKKINKMKPKLVPLQNKLKGDKSTIDSLLEKHYGDDWRDPRLAFYKIIDHRVPTITSQLKKMKQTTMSLRVTKISICEYKYVRNMYRQ